MNQHIKRFYSGNKSPGPKLRSTPNSGRKPGGPHVAQERGGGVNKACNREKKGGVLQPRLPLRWQRLQYPAEQGETVTCQDRGQPRPVTWSMCMFCETDMSRSCSVQTLRYVLATGSWAVPNNLPLFSHKSEDFHLISVCFQ